MNKNTLYLVTKLTVLISVSAINLLANIEIVFSIISMLAFCCLFLASFLVSLLKKKKIINIVIHIIGILGCVFLDEKSFIPIMIFICLELIDLLTDGNMYYQISAVVTLLILIVLRPPMMEIIITLMMLVIFIFARILILRLNAYEENINTLRTEIADTKKKLSDMNSYTKILREMTAMEERNRFASKIHDELGHSISGSIILLEGAKLNIEKNPKQAQNSINIATENLRLGVDNIRNFLREERPPKKALGLNEIGEKLEHFKVLYNINTHLETTGDMDKIPIGIWICLQDNLTETLTNTNKHSNATDFHVKISVHNKIIRAEFRDKSPQNPDYIKSFTKGIGLETIEERTISSGGKCLFKKLNDGFSVTCIFMI